MLGNSEDIFRKTPYTEAELLRQLIKTPPIKYPVIRVGQYYRMLGGATPDTGGGYLRVDYVDHMIVDITRFAQYSPRGNYLKSLISNQLTWTIAKAREELLGAELLNGPKFKAFVDGKISSLDDELPAEPQQYDDSPGGYDDLQ